MISLLIAVAFGYGLGIFSATKRLSYLLCVPFGFFIHAFIIVVWGAFSPKLGEFPDFWKFAAGSVLEMPLLMLGVYIARRKIKRDNLSAQSEAQ